MADQLYQRSECASCKIRSRVTVLGGKDVKETDINCLTFCEESNGEKDTGCIKCGSLVTYTPPSNVALEPEHDGHFRSDKSEEVKIPTVQNDDYLGCRSSPISISDSIQVIPEGEKGIMASSAISEDCNNKISKSDSETKLYHLFKNELKFLESDVDPDMDSCVPDLEDLVRRLKGSSNLANIDIEGEETSRLSDLSMSSEDEDAIDSIEEIRRIHFLLSSSVSSISDDHDMASRLELTENLSDQSFLSSDDTEFYNDWDPGLGNGFGNDMQGNLNSPEMYDSDSDFEHFSEQDLTFPHRAQHRMECEVCLSTSYLRRRVCCDFQICNKCLSTYITLKVKDGKVQMECPNDRCDVLVYKDEIHFRLAPSMREKFTKFLIDANTDPYIKTCPSCSSPYQIDPSLLTVSKKKLKYGLTVVCSHCKLEWCYPCQAPLHAPLSCKKYRKDDEMVKRWAKEKKNGQANAQRCPKCKIFIQKKDGCDHMQCSHCNTDFCYRCGDRYISIKLLGNHWSRFSLFGCKYKLLPQKPALRRLIRGTHLGARLVAGLVLAGLGVAAGAVLLGASVFILPGYGIVRLRRNMWTRKKRKKFLKQKMAMLAAAQREKELLKRDFVYLDSQVYMSTIPEESETETSIPTSDPQQIQVLVHRSVSFNKDEAEERSKDCDILVNKYVNDGTEVFVSMAKEESSVVDGEDGKEDDVVMVTDVQEIQNDSGYSTVVCNIISRSNYQANSESEPDDSKSEENDTSGQSSVDVTDAGLCICQDASVSKGDNKSDVEGESPGQVSNKPQSASDIQTLNEPHEECSPMNELNQKKVERKHSTHSQMNSSDVDDIPLCDADKKLFRELEGKLREKEGKLKEKEDKLKEKEDKLKEKEDKLKEKEDKLKEKEITNLISKSKGTQERAPVSEVIVDKMANNGCFGNIFSSSKRAGSPVLGNQEVIRSETSKTSKTKDTFNAKSATWEKCRKTKMDMVEPLSKASQELTADFKHLPYYLQKSPSSLSSIISFGRGSEEDTKAKVGDVLKPVIKEENMTESRGMKKTEENFEIEQPDTSIDSGYVSQCNFVTYL